jgi:hypothetical protein
MLLSLGAAPSCVQPMQDRCEIDWTPLCDARIE